MLMNGNIRVGHLLERHVEQRLLAQLRLNMSLYTQGTLRVYPGLNDHFDVPERLSP